ncbi:MAG: threonyl-tRNA synthetase, partial [Thermoproteota archaeon]
AEFGRVHRYEKSGSMSGLTRVRSFIQDDAHVFLREDQIQDEIISLIEMFILTYKHIGFTDIKINLSTRPEDKKIGSDEVWDIAENSLKGALVKSGIDYTLKEGDGAFYGPKIDFDVADALQRYHQLGTIQLDFMMPKRFDLNYTSENDEKLRPVVIHRALLGSLERFLGVYIEHVAGVFPFWIAPEQAVIVPVNHDIHIEYCKDLEKQLRMKGYRVRIDDRNESMGFKTRQIQKSKVPFMMVIGDREMEAKSVNLRAYGEKRTATLTNDELFEKFKDLDAQKVPKEFRA